LIKTGLFYAGTFLTQVEVKNGVEMV